MTNVSVQMRCYACGFELDEYPYEPPVFSPNDSVICPSCGIHYGYDDGGAGFVIPDELAYSGWRFGDENHKKIMRFWRQRWIEGGMEFRSPAFKPQNWDPMRQMENIPEEFK